jgi:hypothetical protein
MACTTLKERLGAFREMLKKQGVLCREVPFGDGRAFMLPVSNEEDGQEGVYVGVYTYDPRIKTTLPVVRYTCGYGSGDNGCGYNIFEWTALVDDDVTMHGAWLAAMGLQDKPYGWLKIGEYQVTPQASEAIRGWKQRTGGWEPNKQKKDIQSDKGDSSQHAFVVGEWRDSFERKLGETRRNRQHMAAAIVEVIDTHEILAMGLRANLARKDVPDGLVADMTQLVLTLEARMVAREQAEDHTSIEHIVDATMDATRAVHDQLVAQGLDVSWTTALVDSVLRHQSRARMRFDATVAAGRNDPAEEDLF